MTLRQGQCHGNENEQVCLHKSTTMRSLDACHSLNIVQNMAIMVQVEHLSSLRRSCDFEGEVRGLLEQFLK